ncbi:MAG: hypothetical protein KAT68_17865 [Bacteroidales bacterium]|nr:hypothetical protein [Bacteroidales bacterium]
MKTINQLLEIFDGLPVQIMTEELGEIRQKLIDKKSELQTGLIKVDNTEDILSKLYKETVR